ncbi:MAG: hypothetical protein A2138_25965 [Deltaproteobacteria bacterium RBG_16_71_12]|nr:MAG: hypothetical protein A2138_25965 [Deltaproteobacteria bacterium RBG_16_71_12]
MAHGGIVLGGLVALAGLYAFNPSAGSWFPPCPWLWLTGWQCPGCGVLRGTHALLHGELAVAWGLNPLWCVLGPTLGAALLWSCARSFGVPLPALRVPRAGMWGMLLAVVAFGVLRNL